MTLWTLGELKLLAEMAAFIGTAFICVVLALAFLGKIWSRTNLDTTQFNALSAAVTLLRTELVTERAARVEDRKTWSRERQALEAHIASLEHEVKQLRKQIKEVVKDGPPDGGIL